MQFLWMIYSLLVVCSARFEVNPANDPPLQLFQRYLSINTTTGANFTSAVELWIDLVTPLGIEIMKYEYVSDLPVLVIKWPGTDDSLESIMLNSHMDVVPTNDDLWPYPPFSGTIDDDGYIWGRGTQDMKSVTLQYFEALRRLKLKNVTMLRTVYMTLMPDEETGSHAGIKSFLESDEFAAMNVGCAMDEGAASPFDDVYVLFYQDKSVWNIQVTCTGNATHSAAFPATNETAVGKCRHVIDTILDFRDVQYKIGAATGDPASNSEQYTTVNLNIINAGTALNIVPSEVDLIIDIRLATDVNTTAFEEQINEWVSAAGDGVFVKFLKKDPPSAKVVLDESNPYYVALQSAAKDLKVILAPIVSPGATDSRYVRLKGIPAFGVLPMANTELLLHTDRERIHKNVYLKGIKFYETVIPALANIPAWATEDLVHDSLVIQGVN